MKKFLSAFLCLCMLLAIAGCKQDTPSDTTPSTSAPTAAPTEATVEATEPVAAAPAVFRGPLSAVSMPLVSEVETADDGTVLFTYTYQDIYAILQDPGVADAVVLDLMNRIDSTRSAAESIRATAQADYALSSTWTPYSYQVVYNPTRIDQGVLSLYGSQISYNGVAHPSRISVSANYDLVTGKTLYFGDVLAEDYSAEQLIQLVEEALEPQADMLYSYYPDILAERFSEDFSYFDAWYFSTSGLCFYFSPYDIAPYAAGTIVAQIPYDKLNGILKDAYFPDEQAVTSGTFTAEVFQDADRSQISQYVELILDPDGQQLLLRPEGTVSNVRIEQGNWTAGDDGFTVEAVVFTAECLITGDAVMLQATLPEVAPNLRLTYQSGEETISVFITESGEDGSILLAED